jgi:hypothetical protein
MRLSFSCCALCGVLALASACSDDSGNPAQDSKVKTDNGAKGDQAIKSDGTAQQSVLQAVVNSIKLPKSADEFAIDLDGNKTKDNQLGAMMGALSLIPAGGFNPQAELDKVVNDGSVLLLFDLFGKSLTTEPQLRLQALLGADLDQPANPTDNFSGSEEFGISATSAQDLFLDGTITTGKMVAGPGSLVIPLPIGASGQSVTITKAQAQGTVSASGITSGQINGAIPQTEMDQKLIPAIAGLIDQLYKDPQTDPLVKGFLDSFDKNKDKTISADEIKTNDLLKNFLMPDVDTNGDNVKDALSVGLSYTAVPCKIKR